MPKYEYTTSVQLKDEYLDVDTKNHFCSLGNRTVGGYIDANNHFEAYTIKLADIQSELQHSGVSACEIQSIEIKIEYIDGLYS